MINGVVHTIVGLSALWAQLDRKMCSYQPGVAFAMAYASARLMPAHQLDVRIDDARSNSMQRLDVRMRRCAINVLYLKSRYHRNMMASWTRTAPSVGDRLFKHHLCDAISRPFPMRIEAQFLAFDYVGVMVSNSTF